MFKILMSLVLYSTFLNCCFEDTSQVVCHHVVIVKSAHEAVTFADMVGKVYTLQLVFKYIFPL